MLSVQQNSCTANNSVEAAASSNGIMQKGVAEGRASNNKN